MRTTRALGSVLLVALACALAGCTSAPSANVERVQLPETTATAASFRLQLTSGELRLAGSAVGLAEGTLTYPASEGRPVVETGTAESPSGKVATVAMRQGSGGAQLGAATVWDLALNGGLPTDLDVSGSSGALGLDLSVVDVRDLALADSSGAVTVKLGGPHPSLSKLVARTQSGALTLDASGEYPAVESFTAGSSSGAVSLDVSGTWRKDFTIDVTSDSGSVTLIVPKDSNVVVDAQSASGAISGSGLEEGHLRPGTNAVQFRRKGDKFPDATLTVHVTTKSGAISVGLPQAK